MTEEVMVSQPRINSDKGCAIRTIISGYNLSQLFTLIVDIYLPAVFTLWAFNILRSH